MRLETVQISELHPDPHNARKHSAQNKQAIRDSIQRFGQQEPLVTDMHGTVLSGNCRLEVLQELGHKHVQIVRFTGTAQEAKALAIAMNRAGELATWDTDRLGDVLIELQENGIPALDLGFQEIDLERLFPEPKQGTEPAPELELDPPDVQVITRPQYALIFDSEDQERRFHVALKNLNRAYPDMDSSSERIVRALELMGDRS